MKINCWFFIPGRSKPVHKRLEVEDSCVSYKLQGHVCKFLVRKHGSFYEDPSIYWVDDPQPLGTKSSLCFSARDLSMIMDNSHLWSLVETIRPRSWRDFLSRLCSRSHSSYKKGVLVKTCNEYYNEFCGIKVIRFNKPYVVSAI